MVGDAVYRTMQLDGLPFLTEKTLCAAGSNQRPTRTELFTCLTPAFNKSHFGFR
jgi:hypothetical protein